ncbi:hypothetical protein HK100_012551 [Physocladia obscura]|uniref:GAF domain-containing protein n=1 Tax=Physocladia obscura TaxID=109957 RepID=A0AAD5T0K7_9FUNG|nr:hypothetical protein HK100_012551 [Physocladia obscura]
MASFAQSQSRPVFLSSVPSSLPKLSSIGTVISAQEQQQQQRTQQNSRVGKLPNDDRHRSPPLLSLHATPFSGAPVSTDVNHAIIHSTWSFFATMPDNQRNQFLKGLLAKCSSTQIDLICTTLNLKISELNIPARCPTIYATDACGKFAPQTRVRKSKSNGAAVILGRNSTASNAKYSQTIQAVHDSFFENLNPDIPAREINKSSTPIPNTHTTPYAYNNAVNISESSRQQIPGYRGQTNKHTPTMTSNMYIKLLNTAYDPAVLLAQTRATTTSPDTLRTLFEFLVARTSKQQHVLTCLQSLSRDPIAGSLEAQNTLPRASQLLECAVRVCDAAHGSLYRVDEATGDVSVVASTWAREGVLEFTSGAGGTADRILGGAHLFRGEVVNLFNVKESDVYTDDVHEFYGSLLHQQQQRREKDHDEYGIGKKSNELIDAAKCEVECVLSVPIVVQGTKVLGAIEVLNKVGTEVNGAPANPYFNAEDEQMLKHLCSIWSILYLGSGGTDGGGISSTGGSSTGKNKDDIKMLMSTANFMSTDLDLNGKLASPNLNHIFDLLT